VIYRSPYPDVVVPDVSLPALLLERARGRGAAAALVDGVTGATTTYAELAAAVDRLAAGLHRAGLARGEVAAICMPNRAEFATVFLAVARLGAAATTVNPNLTEAEMARQLGDAGAVVAFTTPELAERVRAAGGARLREVFTVDRLPEDASPPPEVAIDPARDVVALPYSSGTTGAPKGVMLSHRNLVAMQRQMEPVEGTRPDDVVIAVLPFFHIYGLSVILLLTLYRGAALVVFPRFEMEAFLAAVERHRVTRLPLVPPLILRLAGEPRLDDFDLGSVRTVISGAAPLAPDLAERLSARLGGCLVKQGYGMTELSPGGHMHPEDRPAPPNTVGLLHPSTECRLVDPLTGADAATGEPGEIWYRGPQVMLGYLGRPEETAAMITPDGWLRTGDVGRIDGDGQLMVVDRIKELIKYKGFQVAPAELEALLLTHPDVADAAVVPRPDAEAGEVPKAFVVRRPGAAVDAAGLEAFVAERVAGHKRVRAVEFVDEIPRSPSGKILRRVLVERERGAG
jgi:acyl-CoA synthetase (AMP-forming)/AMP-acid ligase II